MCFEDNMDLLSERNKRKVVKNDNFWFIERVYETNYPRSGKHL